MVQSKEVASMARLVITIDERTLSALRRRAQLKQRKVEEEAADILRQSVLPDREAVIQHLQALHAQFRGQPYESSADLIREDRDSR